MSKKLLIFLVFVLIIFITGIYIIKDGYKDKNIYKTEKIKRGDIVSTVSATGTLNALVTINVGTQVSGTIKYIYKDFNSAVKGGEIIARIDPALFEAQVNQAKASIENAKANKEKAMADIVNNKKTFERYKKLYSEGVTSTSELDLAETNYITSIAQLKAIDAQILQYKAVLKLAETNLRYTIIRSPVDGVVISRNVDVGQTVAASFQTPTLFVIAQDLKKMRVITNVSEADIGILSAGAYAIFSVDAYPEISFKGVITQIRNAPIIIQNVVTYEVIIGVDNPKLILKPGMTANVTIIVQKKEEVLKLPKAALRFKPSFINSVNTDLPVVWVMSEKGPSPVKVKTGISDNSFTEVTGGDIHEGDGVIVDMLKKASEEKNILGIGSRRR